MASADDPMGLFKPFKVKTYEVTLHKVTTCKATVRVMASAPYIAGVLAELSGEDLDWYALEDEVSAVQVVQVNEQED